MATNRDSAHEFLSYAINAANDHSATSALIGIGFALLEIADASREANKGLMTIADLDAWTDRLIAANRETIAANSATAATEPGE